MAIAWANDQGVIEYVNPTFTALFGWELADIPTVEDWYNKAYQDPNYRQKVVSVWNKNVERSLLNGGMIEAAEVM